MFCWRRLRSLYTYMYILLGLLFYCTNVNSDPNTDDLLISRPPDYLTTYEGCPLELPWRYNTSLGLSSHVSIIKTDVPPLGLVLLTRSDTSEPVIRQDYQERLEFLPNAGMRLDYVTKEDEGDYRLNLMFPGKHIDDDVHVSVLDYESAGPTSPPTIICIPENTNHTCYYGNQTCNHGNQTCNPSNQTSDSDYFSYLPVTLSITMVTHANETCDVIKTYITIRGYEANTSDTAVCGYSGICGYTIHLGVNDTTNITTFTWNIHVYTKRDGLDVINTKYNYNITFTPLFVEEEEEEYEIIEDKFSSSSLDAASIVVLVITSVVFVIMVTFIIVCAVMRYKRKREQKEYGVEEAEMATQSPPPENNHGNALNSSQPSLPEEEELMNNRS